MLIHFLTFYVKFVFFKFIFIKMSDVKSKIQLLMREGKSYKQAVAIALSMEKSGRLRSHGKYIKSKNRKKSKKRRKSKKMRKKSKNRKKSKKMRKKSKKMRKKSKNRRRFNMTTRARARTNQSPIVDNIIYKENSNERSIIKVRYVVEGHKYEQAFYQSGGANTGEGGAGTWFPFDGIVKGGGVFFPYPDQIIYFKNLMLTIAGKNPVMKDCKSDTPIPKLWFCRLGNHKFAQISYNLGGGFWNIYTYNQIQAFFLEYYGVDFNPGHRPGIWPTNLPIVVTNPRDINTFIGTGISINSPFSTLPQVQIRGLNNLKKWPMNLTDYLDADGYVSTDLVFVNPIKVLRRK